jgi:hypothetical protein
LTISTNYDDLYYGECLDPVPSIGKSILPGPPGESHIEILGRSPLDCKKVLASLNGPVDRRLIWHVQGFLGGQHPNKPARELDDERLATLQSELVIGHQEYRRVANTAPNFRRCFGEVFRSRSFLFLGSNLQEDYFLNMFNEVLELCGPSPFPHFAFTKKGTVDARFLADQMNIFVYELEAFDELIQRLCDVEKAIADSPRPRSWSFSCARSSICRGDFEIINGEVPKAAPHGHAIAISSGRTGDKPDIEVLPVADQAEEDTSGVLFPTNKYVLRLREKPCYLLSAKLAANHIDPCNVYNAVRELLVTVSEDGFDSLHLMLPSSAEDQLSSVYMFSPVYVFIEAIHAFADWRRTSRSLLKVKLYTTQPEVVHNLLWQRINIEELLASPGVRFLALVCSAPQVEPLRRVLYSDTSESLGEVFDDLGVPHRAANDWFASVCPSPKRRWAEPGPPLEQPTEILAAKSVHEAGLLYGSVLTIRRKTPTAFRYYTPSD